jgi:hypothetical protein
LASRASSTETSGIGRSASGCSARAAVDTNSPNDRSLTRRRSPKCPRSKVGCRTDGGSFEHSRQGRMVAGSRRQNRPGRRATIAPVVRESSSAEQHCGNCGNCGNLYVRLWANAVIPRLNTFPQFPQFPQHAKHKERHPLADVRITPDSDRIADIAEGPSCANSGYSARFRASNPRPHGWYRL